MVNGVPLAVGPCYPSKEEIPFTPTLRMRDFLSWRFQCSCNRDLASDTGAGQSRGERIEGLGSEAWGLTSFWNPRFPRKASRWRHRRRRAKGTSLMERKQTRSTDVFFLVVRRNLEQYHCLPCLDASVHTSYAARAHRRDQLLCKSAHKCSQDSLIFDTAALHVMSFFHPRIVL